MLAADLVSRHPTLFHTAAAGTWPSLAAHGLLSTAAVVDGCGLPPGDVEQILGVVRRKSVLVNHPELGRVTIRDQQPLKFLDVCLTEGTSPAEFLHELNNRVFFWLSWQRLERLLGARAYREREQTVLHINTSALLARHGDAVQLAPYNTGSMHVPNAPKRGKDVFVDLASYPYDEWQHRRGPRGDAAVELTVPYEVPGLRDIVTKVETWRGGAPVETLFEA